MALFKVLKGLSKRLQETITPGYCWFEYDTGMFYIDYEDDDGVELRKQLNVYSAETFGKLATVTLSASKWTGESSYSQVVSADGVTANSKVDLQPTAVQLAELQSSGIALMTENDDGVVTVYTLNNKPTKDYIIQALLFDLKEVGA